MNGQLVNKFNLYETVVSKKTGLPMIGTICGVVGPEANSGMLEENFGRWTEIYKDWRKKFVYYILFSSPQKPLSKEEMIIGLKNKYGPNFYQIPQEDLDEMYDRVPTIGMASYPEDDLELL